MSLLETYLQGVDDTPAETLRVLCEQLQPEVRPRAYKESPRVRYQPTTTDVLLLADVPEGSNGLQWIVLRLLNSQQVAIELWEHDRPYAHNHTHRAAELAKLDITTVEWVNAVLSRFVKEAYVRKALDRVAMGLAGAMAAAAKVDWAAPA